MDVIVGVDVRESFAKCAVLGCVGVPRFDDVARCLALLLDVVILDFVAGKDRAVVYGGEVDDA